MKKILNVWQKALNLTTSVWLWFAIVLVLYLLLVTENFFGNQFSARTWWAEFYGIASVFLTGGLISFFFYFLVVAAPERRKRRIIKTNLQKLYSGLKRDIAYQIIFASMKGGRTDLSANNDTVEKMQTVSGFRELFEKGSEGHEGFYAFRNYMSDDVQEFREIIFNLLVLQKQIDYVLHSYTIIDANTFDFFKRLEIGLLRLERNGPGYEEEKELSRFIWDIYGGANWLTGKKDYDPIERMIDGI